MDCFSCGTHFGNAVYIKRGARTYKNHRETIIRTPTKLRRHTFFLWRHSARLFVASLSSPRFLAGAVLALCGVWAQAQTCVPGTATDWMTTSNQLAAAVRPAECAIVEQSPPDFGWPSASGPYQLTVTYSNGTSKTITTSKNWVNWSEVLPAGTYKWQVTSNGTQSRLREFTVSSNATPFIVPAPGAVLSALSSKARPRGLPDSSTLATMKSQRSSAIDALLSDVRQKFKETLPGAAGGNGKLYSQAALRAMAAAVYSQQGNYYNEAVRRLMNLASWDPSGATSYSADVEGARAVAWALAVGYDWLYNRLSSSQRGLVLGALRMRVGDMYTSVMGTIERNPRDSHGHQSLVVTAVISALLAPDLSDATNWLNTTLPLALNLINPWASEEGGFSNGQAQGLLEVGEQLVPWYLLRWATGINVAQKAWVRNWSRYIAYFGATGSPGQVFGDGFELDLGENAARFGKGYTYFAPTPLGRWYASELTGENQTQLEYLLAPPADFAAANFPSGTPNSLVLPGVGQVAMHSDLANPARTSVYFKSSPPPYGSFNHAHADQNSFAINSGGERLAIETGYYDGYKTQHWYEWYHQTRSKNAITYDGGKGQIFYEKDGQQGFGRITRYTKGADYEIVTGDATQAYGGALTKAERSMVYLRPNLILVYDNLASLIPRQWEWNIHSLNAMNAVSASKVSIQNNGQTLCVDVLNGPPRRFEQTDRVTADPNVSRPRQWHGKFYSTELLTAAEFIVLLNVGCTTTTASATNSNGLWTIQISDNTVQISDVAIMVNNSSAPPAGDTSAPSVPTGLTASVASSSRINLTWNASTDNVGVTGYRVYLNGTPLATTAGTSFSHTGLTAGTTYSYRVSAYDAASNQSAMTAAVSATTTSSTSTATPSFWGDWESGTVTGTGNRNWGYKEVVADNRITILSDGGARQGTRFARVEVRPGDNPLSCCSGSERAEVSKMQNANSAAIYENLSSGTQQYAFSVKFDSSWKTITDGWGIFLQLHGPNGLNPAWAFSAKDKIRFNTRLGDVTKVTSVTPRELSNGSLNIGKWIDFIVTVKYAKDNTGWITIQRRDEGQTSFTQVLSLTNTSTVQYDPNVNNGAVGNHYMKYGLYRKAQSFTSILYLDGFTRTAVQ